MLAVSILYAGNVNSVPDEDPVAIKKAKKAIVTVSKAADSDSDGVPDGEDECPNIPGPMATKGCPDTDGDGIPDHQDDCPSVFGLDTYKGCPDTDFDGIPDNKDVCPYEAGPVSNNGCPFSVKDPGRITKVIDSINLDEERDTQIMRYERYVAEQELKKLEYLEQLTRNSQSVDIFVSNPPDKEISIPDIKPGKGGEIVKNNEAKKDEDEINIVEIQPVVATTPLVSLSTVKFDNAMYQSYKPKLEALLKNMRFEAGRVSFADENKFFDALSELASYCKAYPEWKITFNCYSNESDNVYGNNQLFANRVHVLKQILVDDLNIPSQRLNFQNNKSKISEVFNYLSLEIKVE